MRVVYTYLYVCLLSSSQRDVSLRLTRGNLFQGVVYVVLVVCLFANATLSTPPSRFHFFAVIFFLKVRGIGANSASLAGDRCHMWA